MKLRLFTVLAVVLAFLMGSAATAQRGRGERRVVLISIDGFGAYNLDDPKIPLPNIRRLAAEGVRSDRMSVITPSVTWPNHTTLVTGVFPAKHGVLANGVIEPGTGDRPLVINPRRSKEELCRVPTVYDAAHAAGLRTAEINWPVTRGAQTLDFSFPDHPDAVRYSTPALLKELQAAKILDPATDEHFRGLGQVTRDQVWTEAAVHVLKRHKPHLLLLHLLNTDGTQHAHGPNTTEAYTALALADRQVGDVLRGLREAGLRDRTAVFVVADHGFIRVTKQIRPNVRLKAAGLVRPKSGGGAGALEWDAQSISEGGVALVYVPNAVARPEVVEKARRALDGMEGVETVLTPREFGALGIPLPGNSTQAPALVVAAKDGYAFANDVTGEEIFTLQRAVGTHGYVHTNPRMDALFVASGAGIRKGVRLEQMRNVDVAPTIARLLGVSLPDVDGKPLEAVLN